MGQKYLHCLDDGAAYVSESSAKEKQQEVAVLPYEDGMAVIVRAELPNGVKKCTTVKVAGMEDGAERFIVDLMTAGEDSQVVSCSVKKGLVKVNGVLGDHAKPGGADRIRALPADDECGTPAELWASGIKNVPSALPNGSIPFLTMQRIWYDAIECGDKRYELRKQSEKYRKWFIEQHPAAVKLQRGYTNCQMTWEVIGTKDCGADGIVIQLGKRIV